jgi:hypothetical protein
MKEAQLARKKAKEASEQNNKEFAIKMERNAINKCRIAREAAAKVQYDLGTEEGQLQGTRCIFCLEESVNVVLSCSHAYSCFNCLNNNLFESKIPQCAVCKRTIDSEQDCFPIRLAGM